MQTRLGANPLPVVIPVGAAETFQGVIDLVTLERLDFDESDQGQTWTRSPLTEADAELAAPVGASRCWSGWQKTTIRFLNNISAANTRKRTSAAPSAGYAGPPRDACPQRFGAQKHRRPALLDAVIAYLPAPPIYRPSRPTTLKTGPTAPFPAIPPCPSQGWCSRS